MPPLFLGRRPQPVLSPFPRCFSSLLFSSWAERERERVRLLLLLFFLRREKKREKAKRKAEQEEKKKQFFCASHSRRGPPRQDPPGITPGRARTHQAISGGTRTRPVSHPFLEMDPPRVVLPPLFEAALGRRPLYGRPASPVARPPRETRADVWAPQCFPSRPHFALFAEEAAH